jgi:mevalonate kinase
MKSLKVSAPGNIFFFGEHSVVYERPAIVAAVNMRTHTSIEKRDDNIIVVNSPGYGAINESVESILKKRFETFQDYKDVMDPIRDLIGIFGREIADLNGGIKIEITSDIPRESGGMSSSTAVLCSVFGALNALFETNVKPEEYFDWLYPIQVKIHGGAASGSEITSSSMGGYNFVRIDKSGLKARLERRNLGTHSYDIVIGNTGIEAKTKEAVQKVRNAWENNKEKYESFFDQIADIVRGGEKILLSGNTKKLGELMNENHRILSEELGVSHPMLEKLIEAARSSGAFGAKLSGGGMGGIMLALVDSETKQRVADAIKEAGGIPYITTVGVEGVKID